MKDAYVYLSNERLKRDHIMSARQMKYLASLIDAHEVSNPFSSEKDFKQRLSRYEANKAIRYILANYKINWVTPPK